MGSRLLKVIGGAVVGASFIIAFEGPTLLVVGTAITAALLVLGATKRTPQLSEAALRSAKSIYVNTHVYKHIDVSLRPQFDSIVADTLARATFRGIDVHVNFEMKVYVAAAAAALTAGRPKHRWNFTRDFVFLPGAFDALDEPGGETEEWQPDRLGEVGEQSPVLLSALHVIEDFDAGPDGQNVAVHELAHVLDHDDGHFDGIPALADRETTVRWQTALTRAMRCADHPETALYELLGPDAFEEPSECFAYLCEVLIDCPDALHKADPTVDRALRELLGYPKWSE